jgi:hypothetical protein
MYWITDSHLENFFPIQQSSGSDFCFLFLVVFMLTRQAPYHLGNFDSPFFVLTIFEIVCQSIGLAML